MGALIVRIWGDAWSQRRNGAGRPAWVTVSCTDLGRLCPLSPVWTTLFSARADSIICLSCPCGRRQIPQLQVSSSALTLSFWNLWSDGPTWVRGTELVQPAVALEGWGDLHSLRHGTKIGSSENHRAHRPRKSSCRGCHVGKTIFYSRGENSTAF